jgi:acetyltransferase
LGVVVIDYATQLGLGFSKFVSLGNKADVNATDMIRLFADDDETDVILAYLESFSDPWNFSEVAAMTSRKKPIVIVKSGRTAAGAKAASSHTGAMATKETALEATLSKSGVVRVASVEELFDTAMAFSKLPLPGGNRVAVITNAGGPGTLTTDALVSNGMTLATLSDKTKDIIKEKIPEEASVENPIDLIASGGPEEYAHALNAVISDESVDSVIAIFVPPIMVNTAKIANVIQEAVNASNKPVLAVLMGRNDLISKYINTGEDQYTFPIYQFPESAVNALRAMTSYATWRSKPIDEPEYIISPEQAAKGRAVVEQAVAEARDTLTQEQARELFEAYGFIFPQGRVVESLDDVIMSLEEIGFPVVLKMASDSVFAHKSDEGGVLLDLRSNEEVIEAWKRIQKAYDRLKVPKNDRAILVQKFYHGGVEMALGLTLDRQFGPLIMIGSGGVLVEILDDVQFSTVPLSREEARKMIKRLKGYPLLLGYRGDNPVDIRQLEDAMLQLSQMAHENREILESDINPLLALEVGHDHVVLDVRLKLDIRQS